MRLDARRLRIVLLAAVGFGAVLVFGCALVYAAGIGTNVCEHYTYGVGGGNPKLGAWCSGQTWHGWLASCLLGAAAAFALATAGSLWTRRTLWLVPGILLAGAGVWLGFALPQVTADRNVIVKPKPIPVPPSYGQGIEGAPIRPPPAALSQPLPSHLPLPVAQGFGQYVPPGAPFRCPAPNETLTGPSAVTPFTRVVLYRGPAGFCASFTGSPVASITVPQEITDVLTLFLSRRRLGDPNRIVSGGTPGVISVEVWAENSANDLSVDIRPSQEPVSVATVGNLGLAKNYLSVYIKYPQLPAWVYGPGVHWSVRTG